MSDHDHFEELAALSAGGLLSEPEDAELREHTNACGDCRKTEQDFSELIRSRLPLTVGPIREFVNLIKTKPDRGMRGRFLERARRHGLVFSPQVEKPLATRAEHRYRDGRNGGSGGHSLACLLWTSGLPKGHTPGIRQSEQQIAQLKQQNSELSATSSQLNESLVAQQRDAHLLSQATSEQRRRYGHVDLS